MKNLILSLAFILFFCSCTANSRGTLPVKENEDPSMQQESNLIDRETTSSDLINADKKDEAPLDILEKEAESQQNSAYKEDIDTSNKVDIKSDNLHYDYSILRYNADIAIVTEFFQSFLDIIDSYGTDTAKNFINDNNYTVSEATWDFFEHFDGDIGDTRSTVLFFMDSTDENLYNYFGDITITMNMYDDLVGNYSSPCSFAFDLSTDADGNIVNLSVYSTDSSVYSIPVDASDAGEYDENVNSYIDTDNKDEPEFISN